MEDGLHNFQKFPGANPLEGDSSCKIQPKISEQGIE